jgi:hypothetical protein
MENYPVHGYCIRVGTTSRSSTTLNAGVRIGGDCLITVGCECHFFHFLECADSLSNGRYVLWRDDDNRRVVERYYSKYLKSYALLPREIYRADMVRFSGPSRGCQAKPLTQPKKDRFEICICTASVASVPISI